MYWENCGFLVLFFKFSFMEEKEKEELLILYVKLYCLRMISKSIVKDLYSGVEWYL